MPVINNLGNEIIALRDVLPFLTEVLGLSTEYHAYSHPTYAVGASDRGFTEFGIVNPLIIPCRIDEVLQYIRGYISKLTHICTNLTLEDILYTGTVYNQYNSGSITTFTNDTQMVISPLISPSGSCDNMFSGCTSLATVAMDASNVTSAVDIFKNCHVLRNILFKGSINCNMSFSYSTNISERSVESILKACYVSSTPATITFASKTNQMVTNHPYLSTLKDMCVEKGWTVN